VLGALGAIRGGSTARVLKAHESYEPEGKRETARACRRRTPSHRGIGCIVNHPLASATSLHVLATARVRVRKEYALSKVGRLPRRMAPL